MCCSRSGTVFKREQPQFRLGLLQGVGERVSGTFPVATPHAELLRPRRLFRLVDAEVDLQLRVAQDGEHISGIDRLTIAGKHFIDEPARVGSDNPVDLTWLDQDYCLPFHAHADRDR